MEKRERERENDFWVKRRQIRLNIWSWAHPCLDSTYTYTLVPRRTPLCHSRSICTPSWPPIFPPFPLSRTLSCTANYQGQICWHYRPEPCFRFPWKSVFVQRSARGSVVLRRDQPRCDAWLTATCPVKFPFAPFVVCCLTKPNFCVRPSAPISIVTLAETRIAIRVNLLWRESSGLWCWRGCFNKLEVVWVIVFEVQVIFFFFLKMYDILYNSCRDVWTSLNWLQEVGGWFLCLKKKFFGK